MRTLHSILLLIFAITTSAHAQPRGSIDEQTRHEQVQTASAELIGTWQGLLGDTGLRILFRFERTAGGAMRVLLSSPDEGTGARRQLLVPLSDDYTSPSVVCCVPPSWPTGSPYCIVSLSGETESGAAGMQPDKG